MLVDRVGTGRLLMVLDNCEHLWRSAPGWPGCSWAAVPACAFWRPAGGPGDPRVSRLWPYGRWPYPAEFGAAQVAASAAGMLFVERARRCGSASTSPTTTPGTWGMIRRVVEGLPSAVELAAARVRALTPWGHRGPAGRAAPAAGQRPRAGDPATRRWRPACAGASTPSTMPTPPCCADCRSSPALRPSTRRSASAPGRTSTLTRWKTAW